MGVTNQSILDTASTTFHAAFETLFANGAPGVWGSYTEKITTGSLINELDLLEAMPTVREWVGPKQFGDVLADSISHTIKSYEKSFAIKRLKLVGDRTGLLGRAINQFLGTGGDGGGMYDQLANAVLVSNPTCYDGVALFSASHPRGPAGGTQSNVTTSVLSFANHKAILQGMRSLRDSRGQPMRINPTTMIVGPDNYEFALELTQNKDRLQLVTAAGVLDATGSGVAASTVPNVYPGLNVEMDPRLVGDYDDYVFYIDAARGPKPIVCFEMRGPEAVEQTQMDDEGRFINDELRFSVEADVVFGAGAWQTAHAIIV